jgi:hypothetical protein
VLLADVSSSGIGGPPCCGSADWSAGGEPSGDVTVWGGGESAVASESKERGVVRFGACSRRDAAFSPPFPTRGAFWPQRAWFWSSKACPGVL